MKCKCFKKYSYRLAIVVGMFVASIVLSNINVRAAEVVIGERDIAGGIKFVFKTSSTDTIIPASRNLSLDETEAHMEVWAVFEDNNSYASAAGGFVPYLNVNVMINNRVTGDSLQITLKPHANSTGGFYYGRNVDLPGDAVSDSYDLSYSIEAPGEFVVQRHSDFVSNVGDEVIEDEEVTFENVNFADMFTGDGSDS